MRTFVRGNRRTSRSPTNTTGALAASIPSVVPTTTTASAS
jgi:hypothetical protein